MNDVNTIKCDICNFIFANEDILISHYFEANHSEQEMFSKIKAGKIREILGINTKRENDLKKISLKDYYNINNNIFSNQIHTIFNKKNFFK